MLKKNIFLAINILLFCFITFTGCDPIYPPDELKVNTIGTLSIGSSVDIEIIYPNTGGSIVFGWKDQNIEIVNGNDIITVSDLSITGLKFGIAKIKINATTILSDEATAAGYEEKTYSTMIEIKVE